MIISGIIIIIINIYIQQLYYSNGFNAYSIIRNNDINKHLVNIHNFIENRNDMLRNKIKDINDLILKLKK